MGQEHVGKGVHVALGPMMNLGRDAEGGRNWEGFGAVSPPTRRASVVDSHGSRRIHTSRVKLRTRRSWVCKRLEYKPVQNTTY